MNFYVVNISIAIQLSYFTKFLSLKFSIPIITPLMNNSVQGQGQGCSQGIKITGSHLRTYLLPCKLPWVKKAIPYIAISSQRVYPIETFIIKTVMEYKVAMISKVLYNRTCEVIIVAS